MLDRRQGRQVAYVDEQRQAGLLDLVGELLVHHPLDVGASSGEGVVLAGRQRAQRVGALLDQGPQSAGERVWKPAMAAPSSSWPP